MIERLHEFLQRRRVRLKNARLEDWKTALDYTRMPTVERAHTGELYESHEPEFQLLWERSKRDMKRRYAEYEELMANRGDER